MWLPVEDSNAHQNEIELSASQQHFLCPNCGEPESVEEITVKLDGKLRDRALTLSGVCAVLMLATHCYFAWWGKVLPIPDILWAIILSPWLGAGAEKVIKAANKVINKGGPA